MANDINRVILTGNIGKVPKETVLESGKSYVSFSLAVNESYKKGDNWVNNTYWVFCRCWYNSLKKKALSLAKGTKVAIEGSINVYKPQDGDNITSITVSRLIPMKQVQEESQESDEPKQEEEVSQPVEEDDKELPF